MAKSIITQDGDLINYDNLIAVSVELHPVKYDDNKEVDELCIIGTDITNEEILLYHSHDPDEVQQVQSNLIRWLQSEAFSTFEMPVTDEGGDA